MPAVPPDDDICTRALAGDRRAEQELCRRLWPAVTAFARRRLPDAAADDFAADVLLAFVDAIRAGRVKEPGHAGAFALGICRNLARERARTGERRQALLERFAGSLEPAPWEPALVIDRAYLESCLAFLTTRARRVLAGTFWSEDSDQEIGAELSLSLANVRVVRHRTLAFLRTCLEGVGAK